jgi:hypothetical protein
MARQTVKPCDAAPCPVSRCSFRKLWLRCAAGMSRLGRDPRTADVHRRRLSRRPQVPVAAPFPPGRQNQPVSEFLPFSASREGSHVHAFTRPPRNRSRCHSRGRGR